MSVIPRSNNNNNNNNNNSPSASYILRGHSSAIQTLQASDDGSSLLSGTSEGEIKLWNMHTKRCLSTVQLPGGGGGGTGVVKLHQIDNSSFLSQDSLGKLVIWSLKESSVVMQSEWDPYGVYGTHRSPLWESTPVPFAKSAINHDSPNIVAIAAGHREFEYIDLLDTRDRSLVQTYKDKEKLGLCMYMKIYKTEAKETELICGAFENGSLRWWDLRVPNQPLVTLDKAHNEPVLCFDIDSNSTGASGGADNNVTIFKFDANNNTTTCVQKIEIPNSGIADIKIRPDRKLVVTAGWDHRLRVFSWKKYNPLAILKFHAEGLTCVEFPSHPSNNNFWMAAGSKDKRISLWDIYNNNNGNKDK